MILQNSEQIKDFFKDLNNLAYLFFIQINIQYQYVNISGGWSK